MEDEVQVFEQLGHAWGEMEVYEVNDGFWRLFDSAGRKAELGAEKWNGRRHAQDLPGTSMTGVD